MYFYALDQKAGAERGLGNMTKAAADFFTVFNNTRNIKANVYSSMRFCTGQENEYDEMEYAFSEDFFGELLKPTKTDDERNNIYLFLGYQAYNNPLKCMEKIIAASPDAIQAKVLMARAVNQLEREYNSTSADNKMLYSKDNRNTSRAKNDDFFSQTLDFSLKMTKNNQVKEKDFWNLTTAYLYFLNKDFDAAKKYLAQVSEKEKIFKSQKERFAAYIYLCEQPKITPEVEKVLFEKYQKLITIGSIYDTSFLTDVLANRYYLQEDYAKSFLMHHTVEELELRFDLDLFAQIETFFSKPNKNEWEKQIIRNSHRDLPPDYDIIEYLNYLRGDFYLADGDLQNSLAAFSKLSPSFKWRRYDREVLEGDYNGFVGISHKVFGYNQIECFDCSPEDVMKNDYSKQFPFIKKTMNKKELVEALIQLQKIGEQNDEKAAKANYLLGNFFYNVSLSGYYRQILRFDLTNRDNVRKFSWRGEIDYYYKNLDDIYNRVYYKYYGMYYEDQDDIATDYLKKANEQANDNELKARIAFALSKFNRNSYLTVGEYEERIYFSREYFEELAQYKETRFYDEVKTHCKYFEYYVNHVGNN